MITIDSPLLSVIVPVFNEEQTVGDILRRVVGAAYGKQVIVVDDGSTDGTWEVVSGFRSRPRPLPHPGGGESEFVVLRHERNLGKGAAIRSALRVARGEFCVIQDADLEYDPADYPRLIEPLLQGAADVVYGSRYLARIERRETSVDSQTPGHKVQARLSAGLPFRYGVSLLNGLVKLLYGVRLTDEATCYKAFRTSDLLQMDLQCRGFEFCPEVTAKACRIGLRILEVPIRYSPRGRKEGKKIRWRDGLAAVRELFKWRSWQPGSEHLFDGDRERTSAPSFPARVAPPQRTSHF